jgi:hypothetical protein
MVYGNYDDNLPNPDKPGKLAQRPKGTKKNCLVKPSFVSWWLGGENVLP